MLPSHLVARAKAVIEALKARKQTIVTIESCTGGLIASALTSISGSSAVVYGGFVTYDNQAKERMVGVEKALLKAKGAVSPEVARAMAEGGRTAAGTHWAISVTGIAGPTGGTDEKPVGLVHFGLAGPHGIVLHEARFGAIGRDGVREASVMTALAMVLEAATQ